jgi:hypothetical protein
MVPTMPNENLMKRYLLNDLPAEERTRVEDEYFADAVRFEELVGVENDLIDSYARGTLSASERRQFEQHYANRPERRARIDFAKALAQAALQEVESVAAHKTSSWRSLQPYFQASRPQLQWALVGTAVLLVGVLLGMQNYRLHRELQEAQANASQLRQQQDTLREQIEELAAQRQHAPESQQGSQVARLEPPADLTFKLGSVIRDPAGQEDLVIPPDRPWVKLEIPLDRNAYKTYEAVLMRPEQNREILKGQELQSYSVGGEVVVTWRFQANSIQSGDYIVHLMGKTAAGKLEKVKSYSFRAVHK